MLKKLHEKTGIIDYLDTAETETALIDDSKIESAFIFDRSSNKILDWISPSEKKFHSEFWALKNISFTVIGDSHALSMKKVLDEAAKEKNLKGMITGFSGCIPFLDIYTLRSEQTEYNCNKLNNKIFNYIKSNQINKIFLISRWTYYTDGNYESNEFSHISKINNFISNKRNSRKAFSYGLKKTIERYNEIGVEVIFVHQVPLQIFPPDYIYLHSMCVHIKKHHKTSLHIFLLNLYHDLKEISKLFYQQFLILLMCLKLP